MSKPSFLGVVKAVDRLCFGVLIGVAVGALTGAAVFARQLVLQEIGYGGWIEFGPWFDLTDAAYAGAGGGLWVGGFVGFVVGLWRLVRVGKLKFR